jgi:hypothetical protein
MRFRVYGVLRGQLKSYRFLRASYFRRFNL